MMIEGADLNPGEIIINCTIKEKLSVGTYTYQQLMDMLGWCNHNNNQHLKRKQMLELNRWCLVDPVGTTVNKRYHILKIYDKPTHDKPFYVPNGDYYGNHEQVLIPQHLLVYGNMIVYAVRWGSQIYIGSTFDIRQRISKHFRGFVNKHTYEMLQRGGTFELLHIASNEEELRAKEIELIKEYASTGVYVVINQQNNNSKDE